MSEYRYKLEDYKGMASRYKCLECGHNGKFVRYIDTVTNLHLGDRVGKCERSDRCGYHYTPKQHFSDNGITPDHNTDVAAVGIPAPLKPTSFIDGKLMERSLADFDKNNFVSYLRTLFDEPTVTGLIEKYQIGTSKHWPGSTVFWQIDVAGNIRTGKIMQYDARTGKRVKVPRERIQWVHKVIKAVDFNLKQCLFGEHLLFSNKLPVAVVESEKTAIIASGYLPQFTWLASGNKQGLSIEKCNTLKSQCKNVILYADLNAYKDWNEKAKLYKFKISDLLEKKASPSEKESGLDLADYLIRFNVEDFRTKSENPATLVQDENLRKPEIQTENIVPLNALQLDLNPEVLRLHQLFSSAEESGALDNHPQRSWMSSMWQGVMIYYHKPQQLEYYLEQLRQITL